MFIMQLKIFTVLLLMVVTATAKDTYFLGTKTPPIIRLHFPRIETNGSSCMPGTLVSNQTYVGKYGCDTLFCYNGTLSEDFTYMANFSNDLDDNVDNVSICPEQADNSHENVWTESEKETCQCTFLFCCPENKPCYEMNTKI